MMDTTLVYGTGNRWLVGCTLGTVVGTERLKMRGLELRDVTTAAGRALTQILLVGVAHLT